MHTLTLLHSERPKLYTILAFLSAIGLNTIIDCASSSAALKHTNLHSPQPPLTSSLYNNPYRTCKHTSNPEKDMKMSPYYHKSTVIYLYLLETYLLLAILKIKVILKLQNLSLPIFYFQYIQNAELRKGQN